LESSARVGALVLCVVCTLLLALLSLPVWYRDGAEILIIPTQAIDYLRGQDDYVEVVHGARSSLTQQTLQSFETSRAASSACTARTCSTSIAWPGSNAGVRQTRRASRWSHRAREPRG
jgi:hypothetical protein